MFDDLMLLKTKCSMHVLPHVLWLCWIFLLVHAVQVFFWLFLGLYALLPIVLKLKYFYSVVLGRSEVVLAGQVASNFSTLFRFVFVSGR